MRPDVLRLESMVPLSEKLELIAFEVAISGPNWRPAWKLGRVQSVLATLCKRRAIC
jgi:hypothetical protein